MKKTFLLILGLVGALVVGFFAFNSYIYNEKQADTPIDETASSTESVTEADLTTIEFMIEGEPLQLGADLEYFGGGLVADINDDGREDTAFLVTYSPGGTGTFFYAVAVVATETGFVGSDGFLLGDRIAPQTIELSQNPRHKDVIVVNYADRAPGESMATAPSIGKSAYLKLDTADMRWGVVEADFSGEANPESMSLTMKTWVWQSALYNDGREILPSRPDTFSITFLDNNTFTVTTDCNNAGGKYKATEDTITFSDIFSTLMYCEGSQESDFIGLLENTRMYHFTARGELVFDLQFDSGTATFR